MLPYNLSSFFPIYPSTSSKFTSLALLHQPPKTPVSYTCCSNHGCSSARFLLLPGSIYPTLGKCPRVGLMTMKIQKDAAIRELKEETGVSSAEVLAEVPYWLTYDFPPRVRAKLKVPWRSDWKGQAQKWFLVKFTGKEEEINLLGDGTEKPEFGEWSWMSPEEIIEDAVDFKVNVYKEVLAIFSLHLQ